MESKSKLELTPIPRSFDMVEMFRALYTFVRELAELVAELQAEVAGMKAAGKEKKP